MRMFVCSFGRSFCARDGRCASFVVSPWFSIHCSISCCTIPLSHVALSFHFHLHRFPVPCHHFPFPCHLFLSLSLSHLPFSTSPFPFNIFTTSLFHVTCMSQLSRSCHNHYIDSEHVDPPAMLSLKSFDMASHHEDCGGPSTDTAKRRRFISDKKEVDTLVRSEEKFLSLEHQDD